MSLYLLDTDILTLYQQGHQAVCQRVSKRPADELGITVITVEEQLTGWLTVLRRTTDREALSRIYQHLAENTTFLARLNISAFSIAAIERFENLRAMRLNIGMMDLRIAAIAMELGHVLVTRNRRDFGRIPGLVLEDWSVD